MNSSKTLLVLTHQPLTKHNYVRLGVDTRYKGWKIIYWSVLPLLNKNLDRIHSQKGSRHKRNKNFIKIYNYFDLIKKINKLPKNFFYLNIVGNYIRISLLERILCFLGGKKISFKFGPEIELKLNSSQNIKNYLKKNKILTTFIRIIFMFLNKIRILISEKISNVNSVLTFVFNHNTHLKIKKNIGRNNLLKINSPEYQLYLNSKRKKKKNSNTIIFIDDVVEGSFDYKLGYAQDKDRKAEDYWGPVKELLDFVKNKLPNHKLLIAAHHRRNQNDIPISGNKFIFDKTCELIKDSKLILCHNSMASQLAVLFRKPIVFITTDFYKSYHFHSHLLTNSLSKALGTELINVGKKFQPNKKILQKIKSAKVDTAKYKKYEKNYINYPEFKSYGRWQAVLKHLDRIGT